MAQQLLDTLKREASELHDRTVSFRRTIHHSPELSYAEHETARYIAEQLTA